LAVGAKIVNEPVGNVMEVRHESDAGTWTLARMSAPAMLRPWVLEYTGYREISAKQSIVRREVPSTVVGLIINFGSPFSIVDPLPNADWQLRSTFIAGLHERPALVASDGNAYCLQIDFTPLGACRFFNSSLAAINHATTPLSDVLGNDGSLWIEQLQHCGSWQQRFALVSQYLVKRFANATQPKPEVEKAWELLQQSKGRIKITKLAQYLNCSREYCSRLVKNELGMAPKSLAKVIRFETALQLHAAGHTSLADLAVICGYSDQAHFNTECKTLSGSTPKQLFRRYQPESGIIESSAGL